MAATTHEITHGRYSAENVIQGLDIPLHDKIELAYTGSQLTSVIYKQSDETVATLAFTYNGSGLLSTVTRS